MSNEKVYNVKNRSAGMVVYRVPEMNVRRTFMPGEVKRIGHAELEALSFRPGGRELMQEYLQIKDAGLLKEMNIHAEPEYYMDKEHVEDLLLNGTLDQFLDALDFAPAGVIDMIKDLSVTLPLGDYNKRQAMLEKLHFNVDRAIENAQADKEDAAPVAPNTGRRATPSINVEAEEAPTTPRRTESKYNIISE